MCPPVPRPSSRSGRVRLGPCRGLLAPSAMGAVAAAPLRTRTGSCLKGRPGQWRGAVLLRRRDTGAPGVPPAEWSSGQLLQRHPAARPPCWLWTRVRSPATEKWLPRGPHSLGGRASHPHKWSQVLPEAGLSRGDRPVATEPPEAHAKDAGTGWGKGYRMGQLPLEAARQAD